MYLDKTKKAETESIVQYKGKRNDADMKDSKPRSSGLES